MHSQEYETWRMSLKDAHGYPLPLSTSIYFGAPLGAYSTDVVTTTIEILNDSNKSASSIS